MPRKLAQFFASSYDAIPSILPIAMIIFFGVLFVISVLTPAHAGEEWTRAELMDANAVGKMVGAVHVIALDDELGMPIVGMDSKLVCGEQKYHIDDSNEIGTWDERSATEALLDPGCLTLVINSESLPWSPSVPFGKAMSYIVPMDTMTLMITLPDVESEAGTFSPVWREVTVRSEEPAESRTVIVTYRMTSKKPVVEAPAPQKKRTKRPSYNDSRVISTQPGNAP